MEEVQLTRKESRHMRRRQLRGRLLEIGGVVTVSFLAGSAVVFGLNHSSETKNITIVMPQPSGSNNQPKGAEPAVPDTEAGQLTITDLNWEGLHASGWEFYENFNVDGEDAITRIKDETDRLKEEFGVENVIIGPIFDEQLHKPMTGPEAALFYHDNPASPHLEGLYIWEGYPA